MRKHRFFINADNLQLGDEVLISSDEAKHIKNSLRLEPGAIVFLFNGEKEFKAELTNVRNESASARLIEISRDSAIEVDTSKRADITIFLSLIKANNFELALQKVTELGVNRIIPLLTDFSVIKVKDAEKKRTRWEKIIISACKQMKELISQS